MANSAKLYSKNSAGGHSVFYPITTADNVLIGDGNLTDKLTVLQNNIVTIQEGGTTGYKGTINSNADITSIAYQKGWQYFIGTAGIYAGIECDAGDLLYCISGKAGTFKNSDWKVIHSSAGVTDVATTTSAGLMSAEDKAKLDNLTELKYVHTTEIANASSEPVETVFDELTNGGMLIAYINE